MPVYEYQCDVCGLTFERHQHMSDEPLKDCPECDGHVHRVIQPVGVIFKGSGFYMTDNRHQSTLPSPKGTQGQSKEAEKSTTEAKGETSAERTTPLSAN